MKNIFKCVIAFILILSLVSCDTEDTSSTVSGEREPEKANVSLPINGMFYDATFSVDVPLTLNEVEASKLFDFKILPLLRDKNIKYGSFCFLDEVLYFSAFDYDTKLNSLYQYRFDNNEPELIYYSEKGTIKDLIAVDEILFFMDIASDNYTLLRHYDPTLKVCKIAAEINDGNSTKLIACGEYAGICATYSNNNISVKFIHKSGQKIDKNLELKAGTTIFSTADIKQNLLAYIDAQTGTVIYYDIDAQKVISQCQSQLFGDLENAVLIDNRLLIQSNTDLHLYTYDNKGIVWIYQAWNPKANDNLYAFAQPKELALLNKTAVAVQMDAWSINPVARTVRAVYLNQRSQAVLFKDLIIRLACSDNKNNLIFVETVNGHEVVHLVTEIQNV